MACGPTKLPSESAGSETASSGSGSAGETETGGEEGCPTPAEFCRGAALDLDAVAAGVGGFAVVGDEVPEALGDVNGDGLDDLGFAGFVVFSVLDPGPLVDDPVALAERGFAVTWSQQWEVPRVVGAGDVNGDGLDDLIAVDATAERAWVIFGKTDLDPVVLEEVAAGSGGYRIEGVDGFSRRLDDVNGDGLADLAVRLAGMGAIALLPGKGDGAPLDVAEAPAIHSANGEYVSGDVDGDGDIELVSCDAGGLRVLDAPEGWTADSRVMTTFKMNCWSTIDFVAADLNGDGVDDLIFEVGLDGAAGGTLLLGPLALDGGMHDSPADYLWWGAYGFGSILVDINGDGRSEVVDRGKNGGTTETSVDVRPLTSLPPAVGAHDGPACAGSTARLIVDTTGTYMQDLAHLAPVGDVNGDGREDLYEQEASVVITRVCDLPSGGEREQ